MPTTSTLFIPAERPGSGSFKDIDGVDSYYKREADAFRLNIDWSDIMDTGESVSSVSYDASGPTLSSQALGSNVSSIDVTGLGGMDVTVTTSTSRTLTHRVRFYDAAGGRSLNYDYGN